jgi:hypothetical protein
MIRDLPSYRPVGAEWIPVPASYRLEHHGPTKVFPDIQKLPDGRLALDWYRALDGRPMVKAWRQADHYNMAQLPSTCPRVVRQLYRAEFQLRWLRMVEAWWWFKAVYEAERAWEKWISSYDVLAPVGQKRLDNYSRLDVASA